MQCSFHFFLFLFKLLAYYYTNHPPSSYSDLLLFSEMSVVARKTNVKKNNKKTSGSLGFITQKNNRIRFISSGTKEKEEEGWLSQTMFLQSYGQ